MFWKFFLSGEKFFILYPLHNTKPIAPNQAQNRIFSGKMTIQSYQIIFGPTFSAILENLLELFFRNVPKTAILAKNGHFFARQAKFGQNENFSQKSGSAIFLPLLSPNFMPSFGKILGAVSEINCVTYKHTYIQTNGQG